MLAWLRRQRQARGLAQADAGALIEGHGGEAYREAHQRERDMIPTVRDNRCRPDARALAACCAHCGEADRA